MIYSLRMHDSHLSAFHKNWAWFFLWGIALLVLGIAAISAATLSTIISVVFLGCILLVGGLVVIVDTFTFWWRKWNGFFIHLIIGLLYSIIGILLIKNPLLASVSLTLLLGIFYVLIGAFRLVFSFALKTPQWGWGFFNGLISLLLGVLIIANWPAASLYIIGLFIGIDLVFCGWAYIISALSARKKLS